MYLFFPEGVLGDWLQDLWVLLVLIPGLSANRQVAWNNINARASMAPILSNYNTNPVPYPPGAKMSPEKNHSTTNLKAQRSSRTQRSTQPRKTFGNAMFTVCTIGRNLTISLLDSRRA